LDTETTFIDSRRGHSRSRAFWGTPKTTRDRTQVRRPCRNHRRLTRSIRMTIRSFDDKPAVRERVPLLVGLVGPSGGGKTFSALRLAKGFQRVTGSEVYFIDTEARRALHYADRFQFRHVAFGAPFGPLDYLAAIQHCVAKGAKTIIVDSMSHEHEGPGGVLE